MATGGSNEELSEAVRLELEKLGDEEEQGGDSPSNILVRGALLKCSCGSHCRRLNLPESYGVYIEDPNHPKVHEANCIVGDDKNITYFGVCQGGNPPQGEDICLEPYVWPNGQKTSDAKITGKRCKPIILGQWFDTVEDEVIYDADANQEFTGIKMKSFLACKYGGIITPQSSGQEFTEE